MKRYLLLLLALATFAGAGQFFSGVTANQVATASLPQYAPGDQQMRFYASGPNSGTWTASVTFYKLQGDRALVPLVSTSLSSSASALDSTATRRFDVLALNIGGGTTVFAGVSNVTGTIPAPGLFAENK